MINDHKILFKQKVEHWKGIYQDLIILSREYLSFKCHSLCLNSHLGVEESEGMEGDYKGKILMKIIIYQIKQNLSTCYIIKLSENAECCFNRVKINDRSHNWGISKESEVVQFSWKIIYHKREKIGYAIENSPLFLFQNKKEWTTDTWNKDKSQIQ